MMPKDKLKQMLDQQKKASGIATTGETTTPTDGSTPTTASPSTTNTGTAGASFGQRKVRKLTQINSLHSLKILILLG